MEKLENKVALDKHPSQFSLEDFKKADHETRKEVVYYWEKFGQPSKMEDWMEKLLYARKYKSPIAVNRLVYPALNEFYWKEHYARLEAMKTKKPLTSHSQVS